MSLQTRLRYSLERALQSLLRWPDTLQFQCTGFLQPRSNASPGDEKKANGALPHAEANSSQSKSREAVLDSLLPRLSKLDTKMESLGSGSLRGPPKNKKNVCLLQKRLDVQIPQPHVFGKIKNEMHCHQSMRVNAPIREVAVLA